MITTKDEGKGLVKVYWSDIRHRVAKVDPVFAKIVDKLSPDKTFPIYLAYYPYGEIICDLEYHYLPKVEGGTYTLDDPDAPKEVVKHLGYGKKLIPWGMVLEKNIEYFIDYTTENISIPWFIYSPGQFFPVSRLLSQRSKHSYGSNNILTIVSGARSAFMLPNIGQNIRHSHLQREFNLQLPAPKNLYGHGEIFKSLMNNKVINSNWRSCLIYFSENWLEKLYNDKDWMELKLYLHESGWELTEYSRNRAHHDTIFSMIQRKRNLKPNPYLTDTYRCMSTISLGAAPGYVPATNNNSLPLETLQKIYVEIYGLKKYIPTILVPEYYHFETDKLPTYYSLQYPSMNVFSPKSRKIINTLVELRELEHITRIFNEELSQESALGSDTIINAVAKKIQFQYFHNEEDSHHIVRPSTEIFTFDPRFKTTHLKKPVRKAKFCSDAPFLRGCISISVKKQDK